MFQEKNTPATDAIDVNNTSVALTPSAARNQEIPSEGIHGSCARTRSCPPAGQLSTAIRLIANERTLDNRAMIRTLPADARTLPPSEYPGESSAAPCAAGLSPSP